MGNKRNRFEYIDWAKSIAICLIVVGHFLNGGDTLKVILYSFHVPVFYIISGFLYNKKQNIKEHLIKQTKRILIPYSIYFIISIIFFLIFIEITNFFFINGRTLWNSPLWFLPVLFLGSLIFCVIYKLCKQKIYTVILICVFSLIGVVVFDLNNIKAEYFLGLNKILFMIGFFCLGVLFRYIIDKIKKFNWMVNVVALLVFTSFCILVGIVNTGDNISIYNGDYNNIIFYIPIAIIGSISFILLFVNIPINKLNLSLSKNTLFIMSTHYMLLYFTQKLLLPNLNLLWGSLSMVVYILIILLISFIPYKKEKYLGIYTM